MALPEKRISFRTRSDKIEALDSLAAAQDRSRSSLINEAIGNYVALHRHQDALVRRGIEDMRKGRVAGHDRVVRRLNKSRRARQLSALKKLLTERGFLTRMRDCWAM